jgi:hypothetical protein
LLGTILAFECSHHFKDTPLLDKGKPAVRLGRKAVGQAQA